MRTKDKKTVIDESYGMKVIKKKMSVEEEISCQSQDSNSFEEPMQNKVLRIFISSTRCLLLKDRQLVINEVLSKGHLPIAQEYGFSENIGHLTIEKCYEKVFLADATIFLTNGWYGTILKETDGRTLKCNGKCRLEKCIYKKDKDSDCTVSFSHYEFLLATELEKEIYVIVKTEYEDIENFVDSKKKCKIFAEQENLKCVQNNCVNIDWKKNPDHFFNWIQGIPLGLVTHYKDDNSLISAIDGIISRIEKELLDKETAAGLIDFQKIMELQDITTEYERQKFVVGEFFDKQVDAIEDAINDPNLFPNNVPLDSIVVKVLCFRGKSFANGDNHDWEPLIFSKQTMGKKMEFLIADFGDEEIIKRRWKAFPNKPNYKIFKSQYEKGIKAVEEKILNDTDEFQCNLFIHRNAELPFRMIFIGNYLYISFFLNETEAVNSPVYKINKDSVLYKAYNEYYERLKATSIEKKR